MINIPTELLRTLIAVVDLRSFTKAAQHLGVTQPAVSAQLKRLQVLLGGEILDKSAPGVSLTAMGETVVNYARRMLSINDQILDIATPRQNVQTIRIALPGDFVGPHIPPVLADFRRLWPDVRFSVKSGSYDSMVRDLRQGELDILVGLNLSGAAVDARHQWAEPVGWLRGPNSRLDLNEPVPLVGYGEICAFHRRAVSTLNTAGLDYDLTFTSSSFASLAAAVNAGLGVMPYALSRVPNEGMVVWDDGPLPPLDDLYCAVYIREGGNQHMREQVADAVAEVLKPRVAASRRFELSSSLSAANYLIG